MECERGGVEEDEGKGGEICRGGWEGGWLVSQREREREELERVQSELRDLRMRTSSVEKVSEV